MITERRETHPSDALARGFLLISPQPCAKDLPRGEAVTPETHCCTRQVSCDDAEHVRFSTLVLSVEHDRMQELMRMLLLLLRENVVDFAVEISCRLDLCAPRAPKKRQRVNWLIM